MSFVSLLIVRLYCHGAEGNITPVLKQGSPNHPPPLDTQFPVPFRWLIASLIALVILYIALPVAMFVDRSATEESVLAAAPALGAEELNAQVNLSLAYAATVHAVFIVLAIWFTAKTCARRRWARIALTGLLVLATAGAVASWFDGPQFAWAVIATAVVHLIMLALLWLPRSSRDFFAPTPSTDQNRGGDATTR